MLCSIGSWNTLRRHDHIDLDPSLRIAPLDDDVPPFDVGGDLSSIRRRMSCRTTSGSIHRTSHIGIGVQSVFVPQRTRRMAYMTDLTDRLARLLLVTLEAPGLQTDLRALPSLRVPARLLAGIGAVERGMAQQGYDLQLTRYDNRGWRATRRASSTRR